LLSIFLYAILGAIADLSVQYHSLMLAAKSKILLMELDTKMRRLYPMSERIQIGFSFEPVYFFFFFKYLFGI